MKKIMPLPKPERTPLTKLPTPEELEAIPAGPPSSKHAVRIPAAPHEAAHHPAPAPHPDHEHHTDPEPPRAAPPRPTLADAVAAETAQAPAPTAHEHEHELTAAQLAAIQKPAAPKPAEDNPADHPSELHDAASQLAAAAEAAETPIGSAHKKIRLAEEEEQRNVPVTGKSNATLVQLTQTAKVKAEKSKKYYVETAKPAAIKGINKAIEKPIYGVVAIAGVALLLIILVMIFGSW
jgi:hypothetical protein